MARGIVGDTGEESYPTIPVKGKQLVGDRFVEKEGVYPFEVKPEMIRADYSMEVKTNLNTPTLKQLERENYVQFFNAIGQMSQIAQINPDLQKAMPEITKEMAFKYGVEIDMDNSKALEEEKQKFFDSIQQVVSGGSTEVPPQMQTGGSVQPLQ